jgi:hypothetical protein
MRPPMVAGMPRHAQRCAAKQASGRRHFSTTNSCCCETRNRPLDRKAKWKRFVLGLFGRSYLDAAEWRAHKAATTIQRCWRKINAQRHDAHDERSAFFEEVDRVDRGVYQSGPNTSFMGRSRVGMRNLRMSIAHVGGRCSTEKAQFVSSVPTVDSSSIASKRRNESQVGSTMSSQGNELPLGISWYCYSPYYSPIPKKMQLDRRQ